MISYGKIETFYALLQKYESQFPDIAAPLQLRGMLKDFQNLFVLDQILNRLPEGGRLLEVGGGSCIMMRALNKVFPGKYECWNLDPLDGTGNGPVTAEHAQNGQQALTTLHGIRIIQERIGVFSPNLEPDFFDCVFSVSVLEHIPLHEWSLCFKDIFRVLKPGGFTAHAVDLHPLDGLIAADRLTMLRIAQTGVLKPADKSAIPSIEEVRQDSDVLSVSPFEYARWLRFMKEPNGPYRRVASGNSVYIK